MARNYSEIFSKNLPQTQPVPGKPMVENNAGGYVFELDDFKRLERFLILGSDSPTFYVSQKKLTEENANAVLRTLKVDGRKVVDKIVEISDAGRAPSNDPAIFALVLAAKKGNDETRKLAYEALPKVCRTGTHLLHFVKWATDIGGWSRGLRTAVSKWFTNRKEESLVYQLIKYQNRDGMSMDYAIKGAHMFTEQALKFQNESAKVALKWAVDGWDSVGQEPHPDKALVQIWAFEKAKKAPKNELLKLITDYHLPLECIPTQFKNDPEVWEALLPSLGYEAILRNLGNMTRNGYIKPLSAGLQTVIEKLDNIDALRRSRIHPVSVLKAYLTYSNGCGFRSQSTWTPNQTLVSELQNVFYKSFGNVKPTGKRILQGIDVSGSMSWTHTPVANTPNLSPRVASAALALVTTRIESNWHIMGFSNTFVELNIGPNDRLQDVVKYMEKLPMQPTDCALPMLWADKNNIEVDLFTVLTDNETFFGKVHPFKALQSYRQKTGINAKLAVVGMTSNGFSIADPSDPYCLDIVGFDASVPQLLADLALS